MADNRPGRGSDQFIVRFPEGLRDLIKRSADEAGRSMNAEIVHRLLSSYENQQSMAEAFRGASLEDLAAYLAKLFEDVHSMQRVIEYKLKERADLARYDDDDPIPF